MVARKRPVYDEKILPLIKKYALANLGIKQIADLLGIDDGTLWAWKKKHPKLDDVLKWSRNISDDRVVHSLYERATGYEHPHEEIFCQNGIVTRVPTVKHYPPDATSMIFWLKNRQPSKWRDKVEVDTKIVNDSILVQDEDGNNILQLKTEKKTIGGDEENGQIGEDDKKETDIPLAAKKRK